MVMLAVSSPSPVRLCLRDTPIYALGEYDGSGMDGQANRPSTMLEKARCIRRDVQIGLK